MHLQGKGTDEEMKILKALASEISKFTKDHIHHTKAMKQDKKKEEGGG